MKLCNRVTFATLILLMASCGEHQWPPYQSQLQSIFRDNVATISEIEREMINDNLPLIGTGLNKAFTNPGIPRLSETQKIKYAKLFGELDFYANFHRFDSETRVDLVSREARSRTFVFFFSHGAMPNWLQICEAVEKNRSCGSCYVPLEEKWYLEYRWYSDGQLFSPKECLDQRE